MGSDLKQNTSELKMKHRNISRRAKKLLSLAPWPHPSKAETPLKHVRKTPLALPSQLSIPTIPSHEKESQL